MRVKKYVHAIEDFSITRGAPSHVDLFVGSIHSAGSTLLILRPDPSPPRDIPPDIHRKFVAEILAEPVEEVVQEFVLPAQLAHRLGRDFRLWNGHLDKLWDKAHTPTTEPEDE